MDERLRRRGTLKLSGLAIAGLALGKAPHLLAADRAPLPITLAGYPHSVVRSLASGATGIAGCEVRWENDKIGDLNTHVFEGPRERAVSEVGLSPFMLSWANDGFRDYWLLPIFPFRTFRHRSIFIHADAGIDHPSDLKGKRIGTPGYSSTSLTWIRGILKDDYGVAPEDIEWVVSAKDSSAGTAGAMSKNENIFPEGLRVTTGPAGKDESDLLVERDVDALFHAVEPRAFAEGNPKIRRLFADSRATEQEYFERTGVYPVMHAVGIRKDLVEEYPWLSKAVFDGYVAARNDAYTRMQKGAFFEALPWYADELTATRELMGANFAPLGIEPNRKALETLFRYSYEQKLAKRLLTVEEVFEPGSLGFVD